ncbi:hypothetical protein JCM8547_005325 [Rhodosporidiobolus lusitaniae]
MPSSSLPPCPRKPLDLLLLGTGTSSALPLISCLTAPPREEGGDGCWCCRSTLLKPGEKGEDGTTYEEGMKNKRRNTSAVLRIKSEKSGERDRTILIDCGKTFLEAAQEHFPKNGLREIDALILTHAHADAILGLDDLRAWTLRGAIQPTIPIYLTQETFDDVARAFPYLTTGKAVTGGGDIPALSWHVFDPTTPFMIEGIEVVPLPVHHGKFFTTPPSPYFCLGFLLNRQICWLSDVSHIPPAVWSTLFRYLLLPNEEGEGEKKGEGEGKKRLEALVVDCLRLETFTSHFGLGQAVSAARRMGAERNYLVGFGHRTSHALWTHACALLSLPSSSLAPLSPSTYPISPSLPTPLPPPENPWAFYSSHPDPTKEDKEEFGRRARQVVESWEVAASVEEGRRGGKAWEEGEREGREGVWVRPTVDGIRIEVGREGKGVRDSEYDGEEA